jgi:hypothetical protein
MGNEDLGGAPEHVELILAVKDVSEAVRCWYDVPGFPGKWSCSESVNCGPCLKKTFQQEY